MLTDSRNLGDIVSIFTRLIWLILPVLAGLALLVFIWGLVKFLAKSSEQAVTDGKKLVVWGLIALFLLFSFWSIIAFFYRDIGLRGPFGFPLLPTGESI